MKTLVSYQDERRETLELPSTECPCSPHQVRAIQTQSWRTIRAYLSISSPSYSQPWGWSQVAAWPWLIIHNQIVITLWFLLHGHNQGSVCSVLAKEAFHSSNSSRRHQIINLYKDNINQWIISLICLHQRLIMLLIAKSSLDLRREIAVVAHLALSNSKLIIICNLNSSISKEKVLAARTTTRMYWTQLIRQWIHQISKPAVPSTLVREYTINCVTRTIMKKRAIVVFGHQKTSFLERSSIQTLEQAMQPLSLQMMLVWNQAKNWNLSDSKAPMENLSKILIIHKIITKWNKE